VFHRAPPEWREVPFQGRKRNASLRSIAPYLGRNGDFWAEG
jgi:hypothetical protein